MYVGVKFVSLAVKDGHRWGILRTGNEEDVSFVSEK
jgi:hypothetical protein